MVSSTYIQLYSHGVNPYVALAARTGFYFFITPRLIGLVRSGHFTPPSQEICLLLILEEWGKPNYYRLKYPVSKLKNNFSSTQYLGSKKF